MTKLGLYINTVKHLKPSQVFYRVWRRAGGKTPLKRGYVPRPDAAKANIANAPTLPELDFDPVFLARFDIDAIMQDRIELLHHEETVDWCSCWHEQYATPLWRFNLHYFEYLLPLVKVYRDTGERKYLEKAKNIVLAWVAACPQGKGGNAWEPYTIAMRIVNWLAFYGEAQEALAQDAEFTTAFNESLAEQYVYLSQHLEVDLLANHYLEDLKALVILACYFNDQETLKLALSELISQVKEQILLDGMHFELSPMYHKVVLEDLMRVVAVLDAVGLDDGMRETFRLQDMCDVLYSLERSTNRTPLFNDSGDNVAKSRDALLKCAKAHFGIEPVFKSVLPDAGYAIMERQTEAGLVKVVFDAGAPGPEYAMGHAHCDALSFECFIDGEPWIVNCGTYAYQDERRLDFKRTASHSTVMLEGQEQHECWAPFRVARHGSAELGSCGDCFVSGSYTPFRGFSAPVVRKISLGADGLVVADSAAASEHLDSVFIFAERAPGSFEGMQDVCYAIEFGAWNSAVCCHVRSRCKLKTEVKFPLGMAGGTNG